MNSNNKIRVGISHGDINGVSYEILLKTLEDPRMAEMATITIYGSAKIASFYRKALDLPQVALNQTADAADARPDTINIVNVVPEDTAVDPGISTPVAGKAAFAALEAAVADLVQGKIDVLVTCPINKNNIQSETFHFPGHTEYLQASMAHDGQQALMILCADDLRVALVTTHLPVSQIPQAITADKILEKLETFNTSLRRDFRIHSPRIAVLSLNPHAGENGLLGAEEQEIIIPAIEEARKKGIMAFGPYAADGLFGSKGYKAFDGILAMYHDQGLAPFKALAMDAGVNFTAGLPYVRTSPDHGTGYDITGKGIASPQSLRNAIYMAIDIFRNRQTEDDATRNPLKKN